MRAEVLQFLDQTAAPLIQKGRGLDAGAGPIDYGLTRLFPKLQLERQDQVNFENNPVDFVCDLHQLAPLPTSNWDVVFCLETLEHVERPWEALTAINRVLKPGGLLVLTSVMDFPIHRHPHDFWRFCPDGLASLLHGFKILNFTLEGRAEKPQGVWVIAEKSSEDWRNHNFQMAQTPHRVDSALTRWFGFKENLHNRIAKWFFKKPKVDSPKS